MPRIYVSALDSPYFSPQGSLLLERLRALGLEVFWDKTGWADYPTSEHAIAESAAMLGIEDPGWTASTGLLSLFGYALGCPGCDGGTLVRSLPTFLYPAEVSASFLQGLRARGVIVLDRDPDLAARQIAERLRTEA